MLLVVQGVGQVGDVRLSHSLHNEDIFLHYSGGCKVTSSGCKGSIRESDDNREWFTIHFVTLANASRYRLQGMFDTAHIYFLPETSEEEQLIVKEIASSEKEPESLGQLISSYINLIKPHVTVLLLGITVAAMAIAYQGLPPLGLVLATLLGGAMAAGSANCINCYIDRDIDQLMGRTQRRSLPAGKVQPTQALIFGIILGVGSFAVLAVFVNLLSAVLSFAAILFYVFVYTLGLKRNTAQNIVIGGAAGAVPVLVGWAAVTNEVTLPAIWLFAIVFYWTPPHFWALSLLIQKDYEKASVPMLPVLMGEQETRRQIFLYSLLLLAVTLILFVLHTMGYIFLAGAVILGGILIYMSVRLLRDQADSKKWARTIFWYSNCYLAAIFAIMVIDRVVHF
jgi:protoheme IX farnesyltransferase